MRLLLIVLGLVVFGVAQGAVAQQGTLDIPETRSVEDYGWESLKPVKTIKPRYPRMAQTRGQDGWVHMGLTIMEDGSIDDPFVIASYPPGVFDESALSALQQWTYPVPDEGDGFTLPMKNQVVFTFAMDGGNGVRRSIGKKLGAARDAINEGDHGRAVELIEEMSDKAGEEWLNMYELAVLEQTKALLEFQEQNYENAAVHAERTLRFGKTLDDGNIMVTHRMLFVSYYSLEDFSNMVRAYDDWVALNPSAAEMSFAPMVEQIRQALANGRPIVTE